MSGSPLDRLFGEKSPGLDSFIEMPEASGFAAPSRVKTQKRRQPGMKLLCQEHLHRLKHLIELFGVLDPPGYDFQLRVAIDHIRTNAILTGIKVDGSDCPLCRRYRERDTDDYSEILENGRCDGESCSDPDCKGGWGTGKICTCCCPFGVFACGWLCEAVLAQSGEAMHLRFGSEMLEPESRNHMEFETGP